jgi:intergrase/recombinase
LDSRPFPYQVSLSYQGRNSLQGSVFRNNENELDKAKNNFCIEQPLHEEFWTKFKEYLKTTHREKSVVCRLSYAKKYYHVLLEDNAQDILSLSDQKRLQVMKSIASLSKFMGCYDRWKSIKEKYQLKWSDGNNSLEVFQNIVNNETNYDSILKWVKDTSSQIPKSYANILLYCTLTGLRADEACKSVSLIKNDLNNYLNKETIILEHFRYPDIFIRRTKQAFITIVNDNIINLAKESNEYSYNALRCYLKRKNISMNMNYCRKIFATFMRNNGIEHEIIDLLQGRIPKAVFVRHYYRPDLERFNKIRGLLEKLYNQIIL